MDVNALRQSCPLFRGISEEDLTAMLGCLSAREISPQGVGRVISSMMMTASFLPLAPFRMGGVPSSGDAIRS